jgi:hypothetical protein
MAIPGPSEAIQPAEVLAVEPPQPEEQRGVRPRRPQREDEESEAEFDEVGPPSRTSGKATASLVLGILSFCTSLLTGIPAIILAIQSMRDIRRSRGRVKGQGLALAGLITGSLGTLMICSLPVLIGLLLPAVQKVREAANRLESANNLKRLALAMHNYHDTYGCFPPTVVYRKDGRPLYSWRVLLLPFLEHDVLYKQFHLEEPWDSPHNKALLARMPQVFAPPDGKETKEPYSTYYQGFVGPGAFFEGTIPVPGNVLPRPRGTRLAEITDGMKGTIMLVEAGEAVPWTKPDDLPYDPTKPLPPLGGLSPRGFNAAFADGAVRFIPRQTSEVVLRRAITRAGGEVFDPDRDLPAP